MEKAISNLDKAIKAFDLFLLDCTDKGISASQAIDDNFWIEKHKQVSFNSNDNNSIEYGYRYNKQLQFD